MKKNTTVFVDPDYIKTLLGSTDMCRMVNDKIVGTYIGNDEIELDLNNTTVQMKLSGIDTHMISPVNKEYEATMTLDSFERIFPITNNPGVRITNEKFQLAYFGFDEIFDIYHNFKHNDSYVEIEFVQPEDNIVVDDKYRIHVVKDNESIYSFNAHSVAKTNDGLLCSYYTAYDGIISFKVTTKIPEEKRKSNYLYIEIIKRILF